MDVLDASGNGNQKVRPNQNKLSVASVDCVAGKGRVIAKIFHAMLAEPAIAIYPTHPGHANSRACGKSIRRALNDLPDDLVTGN